MSGKSDFLENKVLDFNLGNTSYTPAATHYFALFTSAPTDAGGGTEVSGGSYVRVSKTNNTTTWPNASGGSKSNGVAIDFPTATANWGSVVAIAIFDASSGGNLLYWALLTTPVNVPNGGQFSIGIGQLTVSED